MPQLLSNTHPQMMIVVASEKILQLGAVQYSSLMQPPARSFQRAAPSSTWLNIG